jgi:hypothetical protein
MVGCFPILNDISNYSDQIDLFIVISPHSPTKTSFDLKIQVLINFIRQLSVAEFMRRIRVSITSYSDNAQLVIPLRSALFKDDVLLGIEQIKYNETRLTNTSLVAGLKTSLIDVLPAKRPKARLIGLLIIDDNTSDNQSSISDLYQTLKNTHSDVNLLALGENLDRDRIAQYVGGNLSKVHNQSDIEVIRAIEQK